MELPVIENPVKESEMIDDVDHSPVKVRLVDITRQEMTVRPTTQTSTIESPVQQKSNLHSLKKNRYLLVNLIS